uniref:Uncharacterized protein n=1 Tax=Anguilla anguilla TaxID=7936 RepID=A0A0E9PAW7_ANGAN
MYSLRHVYCKTIWVTLSKQQSVWVKREELVHHTMPVIFSSLG